MPILRLLAALLALLLVSQLTLQLAIAAPAQAAERFAVATGFYLALPPPGWDGHAPLAATLFLHGAGASAAEVADDPDMQRAFATGHVLLVAPDGVGGGWAVPGSPRAGSRDEVAFIDSVLHDLALHFPLDAARIRIAGFSLGASAALYYACARGARLQAVLTVSGAFWRPMPTACPGGPSNWLSIHGTQDRTWPLAGRTVRERFHQGDRDGALSVLRASWQCQAPVPRPTLAGMACETFPGCAGGHLIAACLHDGGHVIEEDWIERFHAWAEPLAALRP